MATVTAVRKARRCVRVRSTQSWQKRYNSRDRSAARLALARGDAESLARVQPRRTFAWEVY